MRLFEFFSQAEGKYLYDGQRWGQAHYNHLVEIRPDLARMIRGTNIDPFAVKYNRGKGDPTWARFVQFLEDNWSEGYDS
jgi:hypothetical protein